jgi:cell division protein FtsQ
VSRIYVLANVEKPRNRERIANKFLWIVIFGLIAIILFEAMFQFVIAPNLIVRRVTVAGITGVSKDLVIHVAGLDNKEYYFSVNTGLCEARLREIPIVKDAVCRKVFPDTIAVSITERTPLAIFIATENSRSVPCVFDEDGVVFKAGKDVKDYNLPVVSGLQADNISLGAKLPEKLIPLLTDLKNLRDSSRTVFDFLSEIKIEAVDNDNFELVLFMVPYATRIRIGSSVNESMLTYALMVSDALKKNRLDSSVRELDFRSKDIVFQDQGGR